MSRYVMLGSLTVMGLVTVSTAWRTADGRRAAKNARTVLHTSGGDVVLALRSDRAPAAVAAFVENCRRGVYRDVAVNEASARFLYLGAVTADGSLNGRPSAEVAVRESDNGLRHVPGAVGFRTYAGPAGPVESHEIYICTEPFAAWDGVNVVFAQVESGMELVTDAATSLRAGGPGLVLRDVEILP